MENRLLFINKKKAKKVAMQIVSEMNMIFCYEDKKKKKIFENENMDLNLHKDYIFINIFSPTNKALANRITGMFYGK